MFDLKSKAFEIIQNFIISIIFYIPFALVRLLKNTVIHQPKIDLVVGLRVCVRGLTDNFFAIMCFPIKHNSLISIDRPTGILHSPSRLYRIILC